MNGNQIGYLLKMQALPGRGKELHALVAKVTAESTDVESWIFVSDPSDPDVLLGLEFYKDEAALEAHENSSATDEVRSPIAALIVGGERTLVRPIAASVALDGANGLLPL